VNTTLIRIRLGFVVLALAAWGIGPVGCAQQPPQASAADEVVTPQPELWPSRFYLGDDAFTVYPLQLERWERDRLEGRSAVAVLRAGTDRPVFGIVSVSARTDVDADSSMVTVHDLTVSSGRFPTAAQDATAYIDAVSHHLATLTWRVPLDRLRDDLAIDQATEHNQAQPLRNDPPRIVYVPSPSILVPIDGEPVLREMEGLGLRRVLNTRALLVQEQLTSRYFLYVAGYWLEAPALEGPWTEARVRPTALDTAKARAVAEGTVDLLDDEEPVRTRVPDIIVSTGPTELVQTDGPPQYTPIGPTDLLFVTNSPNRLFFDTRSQMHYVLLAGRWYRTPSLARGPWEYVPSADLPADFASIPDNHPTGSVRVAVAGTPEAEEATIANTVPQFATVKRTAATLEITYDGTPQFRPIEGTPLQAAVNAPIPVIRVDWHTYYALDNGVWFVASSPYGPWVAATVVPLVVYTIPRSDPLHYVTYVRIYDVTPEWIYIGYTPGYIGSYVSIGGTVVYGSGWYYRPWIGVVWYAPPITWGFGFSFWYTWWDPWPYRVWWAGWRPAPCYRPAWGPWPHHHVGVKYPAGAPHAVVPAKHWPSRPHAPVIGGTRDYGSRGFRAERPGMRDIYGRWEPERGADRTSASRPQTRRTDRTQGARDRSETVARPPRDSQEQRFERGQPRRDGEQARPEPPRWVRPHEEVKRPSEPAAPRVRPERDQRPGTTPQPNAPRWVRPDRPADQAPRQPAPSSPGLRAAPRTQPDAVARPSAPGTKPDSPRPRADDQSRARSSQDRTEGRNRSEHPQRPQDVGGQPHRESSASPGVRSPRTTAPSQRAAPSEQRRPSAAPKERPQPSAAPTPRSGASGSPQRRDRPTPDPGRGSRSTPQTDAGQQRPAPR